MAKTGTTSEGQVALIGMSGRFPGANDVAALWRNLCAGTESITPAAASSSGMAAGLLADVERFDAEFFAFTPLEAELTDPQHRLLLETAWLAMEDAGYASDEGQHSTGVFVGASPNWYGHRLYRDRERLRDVGLLPVMLGNDAHFLATRISYKLDLRGPSMAVQSACSTSLLAVHLAAQSLLNGECDLALAGGVGLTLSCNSFDLDDPQEVLAKDGHCRAFDADASGTVPGEGVALVVMKRYADAVRDGDHVYAVLLGSAVNNDGAAKASYLAPSPAGQTRAIAEALAVSGVTADSIGYVEAHGTATSLGDPIEFAALADAFRAQTPARQFCMLGSVKGNIGHLDAAAGVTGLIKCALALHHRQRPGLLHFRRPNPAIDLANSPFRIDTACTPWETSQQPRRASLNACGFGGTNVHAVLEEAAPAPRRAATHGPQLWTLSARTSAALEAATQRLRDWLLQHPDADVADAAYTLQVGRKAFACRMSWVTEGRDAALAALQSGAARRSTVRGEATILVLNIAPDPAADQAADHLLTWHSGLARHWAHCMAAAGGPLEGVARQFALYWSQAKFLEDLHITPAAISATGVGLLVGACLAGVFDVADALRLLRGKVAHAAPRQPTRVRLLDGSSGAPLAPTCFADPAYWCVLAAAPLAKSSSPDGAVVLSLGHSSAMLLETLSQAWLHGVAVDWRAVHADHDMRRLSMPGYSFERQRYWVDAGVSGKGAPTPPPPAPAPALSAVSSIDTLKAIWREVLGATVVADDDNFFDVGGDSLIATQLISRIRRNLSAEIPMGRFFDAPTFGNLAQMVGATQSVPVRAAAIGRAASRLAQLARAAGQV